MEIIFCSAPDCPNTARSKGLCPKHDARKRRGSVERSYNNDPHPECAVSHCRAEATSRKEGSFCLPHYQKKYRGIDPETYHLPENHPALSPRVCAEPDCRKGVKSNGLCDYHRARARKGKTVAQVKIKRTGPCSFEGCESTSAQTGLCHSHYEQRRRGGELRPLREYGKYTNGELRCPVPNCRYHQEVSGMCSRHHSRRKKYNVTVDEMIEIWSNPICETPGCGQTKRLHMDHDHATGKFRGLLCSPCNTALGFLKENPERIRGLATYIERFQQNPVTPVP